MEANLNSELMQDALVCFRIGQEQVPQEPRLTGPDRSDPCCCKACCLASPLPLLQKVTSLRDNIKGYLSVAFLPLVLVFVLILLIITSVLNPFLCRSSSLGRFLNDRG